VMPLMRAGMQLHMPVKTVTLHTSPVGGNSIHIKTLIGDKSLYHSLTITAHGRTP
jgi:hypothetical protein